MTYSIVARDAQSGHLGVAVASRFFAVGALVPHLRAGVGAIATQAFCSPLYGTDGLALLAAGASVEAAFRSEEHTSELQSLMRISYAVFCSTKTIFMSSTPLYDCKSYLSHPANNVV